MYLFKVYDGLPNKDCRWGSTVSHAYSLGHYIIHNYFFSSSMAGRTILEKKIQ